MTAAAAPAADIGATPAPDPATLLLLLVDLDGITLTEGLAADGDPADPLIRPSPGLTSTSSSSSRLSSPTGSRGSSGDP